MLHLWGAGPIIIYDNGLYLENCNFHTLAAQPQIFVDQLDRERPNFLNINGSQIAFPKDGTKIIFPKNEDYVS